MLTLCPLQWMTLYWPYDPFNDPMSSSINIDPMSSSMVTCYTVQVTSRQCCSCLFASGRTVVYRSHFKQPQFPTKIESMKTTALPICLGYMYMARNSRNYKTYRFVMSHFKNSMKYCAEHLKHTLIFISKQSSLFSACARVLGQGGKTISEGRQILFLLH